jgi:hypothetical protein
VDRADDIQQRQSLDAHAYRDPALDDHAERHPDGHLNAVKPARRRQAASSFETFGWSFSSLDSNSLPCKFPTQTFFVVLIRDIRVGMAGGFPATRRRNSRNRSKRMKSFRQLFLIAVLTALAACSPESPASSAEREPASALLALDSTSEQIRRALLASATRWQTLWMDGTVTWYAQDGSGSIQAYREQVWLEPASARFRVLLSGVNSDSPETFKASDGNTILEMNLITGQSQSHELPEFARGAAPDSSPHVLWGQIGTPISEIALSSNYAVSNGTFKPISLETIAGRETLVVELTREEAARPQWRMWLDVETAVILKLQEFGKGGGDDLQGERTATKVVYNAVFDDTLFGIPPVMPQFGEMTGTAVKEDGTGAVVPSGEDALGELYFFTLPHRAGESAQLVRLPGSCAVGLAQCPQLDVVEMPFALDFNLTALAWSPDGSAAAFAYSDNPNGTPQKMFVFDPAAGTWTSIAQFPYIDPPFWSPDGAWLAFRVQDGRGGEDVYAVRRDGSGLKNLTASGNLPVEGRPYIMDGWLAENIIVRSALPGTTGGVYLLRVSDGTARPMFETLLTKAVFVPAPDNSLLAYDDYDYDSQKHAIKAIEPDGANLLDLISFAGGSVYPVVWSPDSTRLAFAHSSNDSNFNPISDVYVIGRDGRGATQVYKGTTVGRILFSPDGNYLLVEETTSATGGHLFVVNLETLEQKIVSAPGLTLDTDWYAPSWRPSGTTP